MKGRITNLFKFGRIKHHGTGGRVQVEELAGEVHSEIEHPQEHGFASKAPIGSKTYSAYRGGNQDSGAVLIIAGQAPITLAEGDSIMYSAGGATIHCTGSNIEIVGGTIDITGDLDVSGAVSDTNVTTPTMLQMRELFNNHIHTDILTNPTSIPTTQM